MTSTRSPFWTLPSRAPLPMLVTVLALCFISSTQALRFLGERDTFARFPKWHACPNASISFEFKTRKPTALLLYTDDNGRYDYLQLALTKGAVRLWINLEAENQFVDIEANTEPLNDGQWHRVEIRRNRMETILYVDGTQTSKVALGSDYDLGRNISESNYVFFGGVPTGYGSRPQDHELPEDFFGEKFRGEVRNILYFNCSCVPVRAAMVEGRGVSQDRPEACELRNPCPVDCPCVSVDDGSGCECNYKRECLKDLLADYHLPMDEIADGTLVNPSGLDSVVRGGAQLVPGVRRQALQLDGRSQWLRVTGADHRRECFGDLARCEKGYYMGLWMQFRGVGYQKGVYLSNGGHSNDSHGVALLYSKGRLQAIFKMADGREWSTEARDVVEGRWYHVAATWSQNRGLFLYINGERRAHDRVPARGAAPSSVSRYNGFYIGRANDNTGTDRLGQVLVDDFVFMSTYKNAKGVRESGPMFHYHVPMELASQRRLSSLRGLQADKVNVHGAASRVQGKVGNALMLSGDREYLDLGDVTDTCLGDLDLCGYGVYVSLWLLFNSLEGSRKAVVSSPVLGLHQDGNALIASAHNLRRSWETRYQGLSIGAWHFVELSWHPEDGLSLYVDLHRVGHKPTAGYRLPEPPSSMNMFVGRESARRGVGSYPAVTVDELDMFYADRATLMDIGFIQRDRPDNYHFDMDAIVGDRLAHDTFRVTTQGRPQVVPGKVGNAILLDGRQDALDFGNRSSECFGNLDQCPHGAMVSLWLRPERLGRAATSYFLSSGLNGLTLSYRNGQLHVTAATTGKTWAISTSDLNPDEWQFVEVSFHPDRGLRLYESGRLIAESSDTQARPDPVSVIDEMDRFYVGRGNVDMSVSQNRHGAGAFDELDVWYADRDFLTAHDFIQRDRPENVLVQFEEAPDQTRITHPSLDITLRGRPRLVPGKVGNALELRGRGQYADLGQLSHTCMGNLGRCPQGVTVSAWMRFRSYENNMVFLSTGENGLLLLYRDGYIYASADGRGLVTAPRFDTNRWYYVELSWHPDYGLRLFVDNELIGESPPFALRPGASARNAGHFYLGRPNDGDVPGGRYTSGNFDIDELEVWNGRREDLLAFGYIQRESSSMETPHEQGHEAFSMDSAQGDRLTHPHFIILLVNGATLGPGRVGQALHLNGRGQYLDLGTHMDSCLGNLEQCLHGFTLSLWLNPNTLRDNVHFLAGPHYSLFYEDGELKGDFHSAGKSWTVSTPRFRAGEWQRVTLTWHQEKGLSMYVDDELVDVSGGVDRPQRDQPASDHVYVGRGLQDARLTADMQADDLQVWYDYLDQLRATGRYRAEVRPRRIRFDNIRDGYLTLRDRRIQAIGEILLIPGLARDSRAVYLDGRTQYLDFGDNFTCNGNLENCRQGFTYRFGLRPDRLVDGMYFMDSYPIKLYYKDGRLHAETQTSTRVWNVDTSDFREGQWSRVELTWHPTQGLTMYMNGRRVDHETYPRERPPYYNRDWRTYLGRPLSDDEGSYANTVLDDVEFYNVYRTYVPEDRYLTLIRDQPPVYTVPPVVWPPRTMAPATLPPGVIIGETGVVTTQRPPDHTRRRTTTTIIRLDGASFVRFNFERLPAEYLTRAQEEEFSFYFLTDQPEGLIWFHEEPRRNLYIAMKDGHLVFVNDDKSGPADQVSIGERYGVRFDDYRWHKLKIRRNGRRIRLTVDDNYQQEYIFDEDVQFLTPAQVWLGGTANTVERTGGNIRSNFNGGVAEVIYITTNRVGSNIYRNEVNLIARLAQGSSTGSVITVTIPSPWQTDRPTYIPIPTTRTPRTTRPTFPTPPPARTTSVTIVQRGVYIPVYDFAMRTGSSISFNFKTINQNGLVLFAGDPRGQFMAVELVDGRLYFVKNFGRGDTRTPFSQRIVSDGQPHELSMRFYDRHVDLRVDGVRERVDLVRGERLPTNMATVYVGGYTNYRQLPWRVWSQESYLGCLSDFRVNSRIVDFEDYVTRNFGRVVRRCQAMPQDCVRSQPCRNGVCRDSMTDFLCDCSRTGFRGERCSLDAWTALFNGSVYGKLDFSRTLESHVDNMHLRFRTPLRDGLLFETFARGSNVFLRCSLENGRVKVETNLGGELRTLYAGEDLNDLNWHTLYIQRRGNEMEVWVDDDPHVQETLAGSGYQMAIDRIYLGGTAGSDNRYIGYLQNFYMGDMDVLEQMRGTELEVGSFISLPPLIYYPVTFPDYHSFITLSPLRVPLSMVLHFMFKTEEPNGIILFSSGRNRDYLVVELFEGKLHFQFNTGSDRPLRATAEQIVNDGKWHTVTLRRSAGDQRQFLVTVDGVTSSVSYAGAGLDLQGPLYIGGAPEELLQKDYIRNGVLSRTGFRGCLASMDLSGQVPDLGKFAQQQGVTIYDSCRHTAILPVCTEDSCRNFGTCIESGSGTYTCNCDMTAHSGSVCENEPIGFLYQNFSRPGLLIYDLVKQPTTSRDEIAFGLMTRQENGLILRIFSELINDYIDFRLRDGHIVVEYDTDGAGGKQTIAQLRGKVNDGETYHIIRFIRTPTESTLLVDDWAGVSNAHSSAHGDFDRMSKIYIGGGYDSRRKEILDGFAGIIGGLHINGLMVFPEAIVNRDTEYIGDVVVAPRPFSLYPGVIMTTRFTFTPTPSIIPTPTPPILIPPVIPPGIGGGGAGWVPGVGGGGNVVVYPGGDSGTGVLVPGPGAGAGGPAAASLMALPPPLSGAGPRAGAVMGTILGLMALASSLMWAFYRCKPGWCTCLRPAGAAPMSISSPRAGGASASNKGAVIAAGGGVGGAGGAINGAGGGAGAGGAGSGGTAGGGSFSNFYMTQSSSGMAGGGGGGGGEAYDTATLRATGTFSNKGTSIGTPKPVRAHLGSTASAGSAGGYSSGFQETSHVRTAGGSAVDGGGGGGAMTAYHYEAGGAGGGSSTADYDMATGVANYQSNTLTAGGGSMGGAGGYSSGGMGGGGAGGFSSSTMQSSYNYSVKTVRTVSGQQQMLGYADSEVVGIPPGALGEEVRVDCCLMTTDGHSVVTGSSLGPPQVWDMQSGELLRIMQGETVGSTNLHLACNDRLLVGAIHADLEANQLSIPRGVHNYKLQIWDFTTGRALDMSSLEACSALTMMSDNDKVLFARTDKYGGGTNVVVWDLLGNQAMKQMRYDAPVGNNDYVHFLAVSNNDRYVIAGFTNSFDNFAEFVVFDMALTSYTVSDPSVLRLDANPECTAILPGDEAVTGLRNGDLVIWNMHTGQPSRQLLSGTGLHAHAREVKAVARSEDGRYLVSASADGTLKIWDMEKERHINTLSGHADEVWCCAISPDNEIIVSGSRDRTIRLWRLKNGSEICSFNAGVDIFHVTMSRDKSTIVALGDKLGARKLIMLQVVRTRVRRQVSS